MRFCRTARIGCLLIYRWFQGTKDIRAYHTSRVGTLLLEAVLICCFARVIRLEPLISYSSEFVGAGAVVSTDLVSSSSR